MIIYSDNNAAEALVSIVGENTLQNLFKELTVPLVVFNEKAMDLDKRDFITPRSYALFLRVLYNATYIDGPSSEKAMELLTQTDFTEGLAAGVPGGVKVAHKFGLFSLKDESTGQVKERELHDCGIVFKDEAPYIICVMTKSRASIPKISEFIKQASEITYQYTSPEQP